VFGEVNPAVLDDLVRLCVQLAGHGHGHGTPGGSAAPSDSAALSGPGGSADTGGPRDLADPAGSSDPAQAAPDPAAPDPGTPQALQVLLSSPDLLSREALERAIIGKTTFVLLHLL
jgi:hypothetical protein